MMVIADRERSRLGENCGEARTSAQPMLTGAVPAWQGDLESRKDHRRLEGQEAASDTVRRPSRSDGRPVELGWIHERAGDRPFVDPSDSTGSLGLLRRPSRRTVTIEAPSSPELLTSCNPR